MTGQPVAAEYVWFICTETCAYDTLLYRAMAAEYQLAEAFSGNTHAGLWISDRHMTARWEPFERACLALLGASS
jgi:hypothetical protein